MRITATPSRVATAIQRLEFRKHLWNYRGPVQNHSRRFLGITIRNFFPGISTLPPGLSFLIHQGHKGWSLAGHGWSISLFRLRNKWHFTKAKTPTEAIAKISFNNTPLLSKEEWDNIKSEQIVYLSKEQAKAIHENEFAYDVNKDDEFNILNGSTPPNPRPLTDQDKYEYDKDPFYTQWPGGTSF